MSSRPSMDSWGNRLYTGEISYDFVGRRRLWYAIAAVVVLISLLTLVFRGLNLGIEFSGGSSFTVSDVAGEIDQNIAVEAVQAVDSEAVVQVSTVGGDSVRVQTGQLTDADTTQVQAALAEGYGVAETDVSASFVGPSWGQDVSQRAIQALLVFLVLVAGAIALYFRTWKMAVAAIVALIHDLIATVGIYAIVGFEVTPASVIGFLTILGYSLYDTVVVFDKVRENTEHVVEGHTRTFAEAANLAVNQTLVRSINTSVVALLPVAAILFIGAFVLGAGTLQDLSLALFVGIAVGAYSSIFIATPLLVHLREGEPALVAQAKRVMARRERGPERVLIPTGAETISLDGDDGEIPMPRGDSPAANRERRPPMRTSSAGGQRPQPRRGRSR